MINGEKDGCCNSQNRDYVMRLEQKEKSIGSQE